MKPKLINEIFFIRAVACLFVVLVHVTSVQPLDNYFNLALNQISRLGTPIFAAISAFLLFHSVLHKGFQLKRFVFSRTTKILIPFLVWSLFYLCFQTWYLDYNALDVPLTTYVFSYFFLGGAFYHLYFMSVIFQFYLLFPLFQRIRNQKVILTLFLISLPINYVSLTVGAFLPEDSLLHTILSMRPLFTHWISYFLFGAVLASYFKEILQFVQRQPLLIAGLFTLILAGHILEIDPNHVFSSSRPSNLLYIPAFILVLLKAYPFLMKRAVIANMINLLGNYSMGIFLIHPFVISLLKAALPDSFFAPHLILLTFAITTAICTLLVRLLLFLPFSSLLVTVTSTGNKGNETNRTPVNA